MKGIDGEGVGSGTGGADERCGAVPGAEHGDAQSNVTGRKGPILGTRHIYRGEHHKGLRGWDVVAVGVIRGEELLTREEQVGELQPGDRLEVRPVIEGRLSFVSYDAEVEELEQPSERREDE